MNETTKLLTVGIFVALATSGTLFLIQDTITVDGVDFHPYECGDTIGYCHKLSSINSNGLQTRCYNNASSLRRYKFCSTGWTPYIDQKDIRAEEINLTTHDDFKVTSNFKSIEEAKKYISDFKSDLIVNVTINNIIIAPTFDNKEVFWTVDLIKEGVNSSKIITSKKLSTIVLLNTSMTEISSLIEKNAKEWKERWVPKGVEIVYE